MNIEAPDDCIAIWMRADIVYIRFPDRQLIEIPSTQIGRLVSILRARENQALKVAMPGAPTQWQMDQSDYDRALSRKITGHVQSRLATEQRRAQRIHDRAKVKADAMKLLEELGL